MNTFPAIQVIIEGFKSYKDQTISEPFSPRINIVGARNNWFPPPLPRALLPMHVVTATQHRFSLQQTRSHCHLPLASACIAVGANGSGKSNFFDGAPVTWKESNIAAHACARMLTLECSWQPFASSSMIRRRPCEPRTVRSCCTCAGFAWLLLSQTSQQPAVESCCFCHRPSHLLACRRVQAMRSCLRTWRLYLTTPTTACRQAAMALSAPLACYSLHGKVAIVQEHSGRSRAVLITRWTAMRCGFGVPLGSRRTSLRWTGSTSRARIAALQAYWPIASTW